MFFTTGDFSALPGAAILGNVVLGSDEDPASTDAVVGSAGHSLRVHSKTDARQLIHAKGGISE
jgi:hypothetical protein